MNQPAFSAWIGRTEEARDQLSLNLVKRIAATLSEQVPAYGKPLPPLWHWAFFQEPVEECGLGLDGHPARGGFLPPADNRNRMWAGGRVEFIAPLKVGFEARKISTITHIEEKRGRTGDLLFVTLRHDYLQEDYLALREEQDIVYREPTPPKNGSGEPLPPADWLEAVTPSATLLFRYSAVTLNAHRIHYDWPYATETEGYPGLVVQGPLTATLNLRAFCRANPQARLRRFAFRGVRPLIAPQPFAVGGRRLDANSAELWAGDQNGLAQRAEVQFD
ncbi:transposase [Pseudomonas benzenivorans]|uniref:Transposase n=1 Tax=Pseudomonas benzenivorans TaxID=556533 RepID=A0ABZ0Q0F0_9PSED|nr:transposase [Pseudomonas benzenivorans]WPC06232.1 transposase [Pseudomonas benzenivorans]